MLYNVLTASLGQAVPAAGALTANAGNVTISNLSLYLAVEQNQEIVNSLRTQISSPGAFQ